MDHLVYVDAKENEMQLLINKEKTMIIRGATGRKVPYNRVNAGDILYFINNNGEGKVKTKAEVSSVFNSEKMSPEESTLLVENNQNNLKLTEKQFKRWAGKRYIVLIGIKNIQELPEFEIDKSDYKNMDDWLIVEDINNVKK